MVLVGASVATAAAALLHHQKRRSASMVRQDLVSCGSAFIIYMYGLLRIVSYRSKHFISHPSHSFPHSILHPHTTVKKSDYWAKKSAKAEAAREAAKKKANRQMKKLGVAPWSGESAESTDSASTPQSSSTKKKKMAKKKDQQATATARCHAMVALASMAAAAAEDGIGDDATTIAVAANEEETTATTAGVDLNEKLAAAADSVTTGNPGNANDIVSSKSIIPKENDCAAMIAAEAMSALFAGKGCANVSTDDGTAKTEAMAKDQSNGQPSSKVEKDTSASSAPSTPSRKKGLSYASTNSPSRQSKKQKTGGEAATANPPKKGRVVVRGSGRAGPKNIAAAHPIPPHAGHYNWTGAGNPYLPHNHHYHHHVGYADAHAAYSQYPPPPPPPTDGQYAAASSTNTDAGVPTSAAPVSYPVSYSYPYYPPHASMAPVPAKSHVSESNASKLNDAKETGDASTAKPQQSQSSASASAYPPHSYNLQQQYPPSHAYYYHHHPSHAQHHHYSTAAAAPHHQHYQQQQQQQWAPAQPPRRG